MNEKEEIKRLKNDKNYEEIYRRFGRKTYLRNAPFSYRKKDMAKLLKEGKYQDIFYKYGKDVTSKAQYEEIKEKQGRIKALLWKFKRNMKIVGLSLGIASSSLVLAQPKNTEAIVNKNEVKYENEIEIYNKKIKKYAQWINSLNLNDLQIFMKVIDDMWNQIEGYKEPELDIIGFLELDLARKDGYGVCRNMASDVAKKLNAINPEYNARTMFVTVGHDGKYEIADVEVKILEDNETVNIDSRRESTEDKMADFFGNHMITLVDIKSDNLIMVLDPTNPGIGIYQNGKIEMLNSVKGNEIDFDNRNLSTFIGSDGYVRAFGVIADWVNSYKECNLSKEQIEEKYGLEAQNKALEEVRKIQKMNDISKKNQFKEELAVKRLIKNQKVQEIDKIEREDEAR